MRNVNSAKLHELATELTSFKVKLPTAQDNIAISAAVGAVKTLAAIHELLSDEEYDSDTPGQIANLLRAQGLPVFNHDGACDEPELRAKYGNEGHPRFTRKEWKTVVHTDDTILGYWEWVDLQIAAGD